MMVEALEELHSSMDATPSLRPVFLWKSAEVPCIPSSAETGFIIVSGGQEMQVKLSLNVLISHFHTADTTLNWADSTLWTVDDDTPHPVASRKLTFRGTEFRILTVNRDVSSAFYKLTLGDPNV